MNLNIDLSKLVRPLDFRSIYTFGRMRCSNGELSKLETAIFRFKGSVTFSSVSEFIFNYNDEHRWRIAGDIHLQEFCRYYQRLRSLHWFPPIAALGTKRKDGQVLWVDAVYFLHGMEIIPIKFLVPMSLGYGILAIRN